MQKQHYGSCETEVIQQKQSTLKLFLKPAEEIKEEPKKLKEKKKVIFAEDTVDNEGMNKKRSNICCVYHKPRNSTNPRSSSSSTCTSDDQSNEYGRSRQTKKQHKMVCSKRTKKCCGH